MNLEKIRSFVSFFTDRGAAQLDTYQNAAKAISDPSTPLIRKLNYEFGKDASGAILAVPEQINDYIGIAYLRKGADVLWHDAKILVDSDAALFTCELGLMDAAGNFTAKATMGAAVDFVSGATIPEPHAPVLDEPTWVVAKITALPGAGAGKVSFYLPHIALG